MITDEELQLAMKVAVRTGLIQQSANGEADCLKRWDGMREVLQAVQSLRNERAGDPPRPRARDVGRLEDMSRTGTLRVGLDGDGDAYVSCFDGEQAASVEFCTSGGKSPNTHRALIALMVAIESDNADDPARDWWALRNAKRPAGSAG